MTYERLKRYRQTRNQALRFYNLCLPEHLVEIALVDAGVISPKEADDAKKKLVALQVEPNLVALIDELAQRQHRTRSDFIRQAVLREIEKQGVCAVPYSIPIATHRKE